jgi:hypothetical protein
MRYQHVTKKVLRHQLKEFEGFNPMDKNQKHPVINTSPVITTEMPVEEAIIKPARDETCPEMQSMKRRNPDFYDKMMNWE